MAVHRPAPQAILDEKALLRSTLPCAGTALSRNPILWGLSTDARQRRRAGQHSLCFWQVQQAQSLLLPSASELGRLFESCLRTCLHQRNSCCRGLLRTLASELLRPRNLSFQYARCDDGFLQRGLVSNCLPAIKYAMSSSRFSNTCGIVLPFCVPESNLYSSLTTSDARACLP